MASPSSQMSNSTSPYDEERMNLSMLVEAVEELESDINRDATSELVLEQLLLQLLSCDEDDDAGITSNFPRPSTPDEGIFERQQSISAEPATSLAAWQIHTARAPVWQLREERRAERIHQSGPDCWVSLSVGWPQSEVSLRRFGMVHWSHTPYIGTSSPYVLPQTFLYPRAPLDSFNGVPGEFDTTAGLGMLFYPDSLLPLPPL